MAETSPQFTGKLTLPRNAQNVGCIVVTQSLEYNIAPVIDIVYADSIRDCIEQVILLRYGGSDPDSVRALLAGVPETLSVSEFIQYVLDYMEIVVVVREFTGEGEYFIVAAQIDGGFDDAIS